MADSYKNNIQLGIKIDPQNQSQKNLETIISKLNENKINLDLTIKGDASKQLESLSILIDTLKSKMGGEISLGNLDKVINNSVNGLNKLNGELQKMSQTNFSNGTKRVAIETETAIGELVTQTQKLDKNNNVMGDGIAKTTTNLRAQAQATKDVVQAQEKLNSFKLVDQNKVADLEGIFTNISANEGKGYSTNQLNDYLNQVKQLEVEENKLIATKQKEAELNIRLNNAEFLSSQTNSYKQLFNLQNEEYSLKEKLINAEGEYKQQLESRLVTVNELKNAQKQNIQDNNLTNKQKELELTSQQINKQEQLNQLKAKINTQNDASFTLDLQKQNEYLDKAISKLNQYKQDINNHATNMGGDTNTQNQTILKIDEQISKINQLREANNLLGSAEKNRINESISGLKSETNALTEHQHGFMDMVKSMATMATTGALMFGSLNKLKEGTEWVKYLDESFTDMAITMNITREQFDKMSVSIDDMSKKLGVNAKDVHDIARVYANASASVDSILSKVRPEAMLSNISGISGDSITKTVQATTYAFDMLNESESNAGQVTEHIGDTLTKISQNMKFDFQSGIVNLNDAIRTSGSVARESGMSLEQYSAYMGALIERTGKTGSELGTFWKMLTARVQQIKAVGDEVGISREDMGNAEKALTSIGVSVRGENDSLRDMDSVLKDVNSKWSTLSEQKKSEVAEGVAGNRHRATFLSLMKSMTSEQNLYNQAMNSTGALEEANDKKAESLQGKLNTLKDTVQVFFDTIINGNALKGGVDVFSNIIGGVTNVTKAIGTLPTILTTTIGALTIFNSKFRESMTAYQPTFLTNWVNELGGLKTKLSESIGIQKQNITSLQTYITEQQNAGNSTVGLQSKLALMQAGLVATTAKEIACTVATVALQTAFTMGLSLVITGVVSGLTSLANSSDNAKQKMEELSSSIKQESDAIAQSQTLLKQKEDLESKISKTSEGTKENTDLKKQLLDVERQISDVLPSSTSGFDSEGKAISANTDMIKAQIQAKKDKLAVDAQELLSNAKNIDRSVKEAKLIKQQIEAVKLAQKQGNPIATIGSSLDTNETTDIRYTDDYVSNEEKRLTGLQSTISSVRLAILQLKQAGKSDDEIKTMFPQIDSSAITEYSRAIENNTAETNENTQAKTTNANTDNGANKQAKAVDEATESYNNSTQSIAKAQGYIDKLNKANAVTPSLAKQIAKSYDDIGTNINNVGNTVDFLKGKIKEQQEEQESSLMILKGEDSQFYSEKVKNNQEYEDQINGFLSRFVGSNDEAYHVDLGNYTTLNQMKAGTTDILKVAVDNFMKQFVDTSASGYSVDYNNFGNLISAKSEILKQFAGTLASFWDETSQAFTQNAYGGVDLSGGDSNENYSKYTDKAKGILATRDKIRDAYKQLDGVYSKGGLDFKGFDGGGGQSDFGGTGGSGGGKSGTDKAEKEAEDALKKAEEWTKKISELNSSIEIDRYAEANNTLTQLANQLQTVKIGQDTLTGSALADSKAKENEIIQKQIDAYKRLQAQQEIEKDNIAYNLSQYGILKDATGNLTNAYEVLAQKQNEANNMSGDTEVEYEVKKSAIESVKQLSEEITKYGEINNKTIPDTINKWEELANTIKKAKEEARQANIDILNNAKEELAQDILKDAQEQVDNLKKEAQQAEDDAKQALEDEKTSKLALWDEKIKSKQAELDALDDESSNNEEKLKKIQEELALWKKDNSTESIAKIADLTTQQNELQKTIAKDKLSKEIDSLNDQKTAESDSYDKQLTALEKANKEQEAEDEEHYKDMLNEKKAYAKAEEMINKNQRSDMYDLYSKYSEDYKKMGADLSTSVEASLKKITDAMNSLNEKEVKIKDSSSNGSYSGSTVAGDMVSEINDLITGSDSSSSSSSSSSSKNNNTNSNGSTTTDNSDGTTTTTSSDGKTTETSGTYSNGTSYTIVKHNDDDISSLSSGGRTPDNIDDGALSVLHSNEVILNANDTVKLDEMYDYIRNSGALLSQLSNQYSNIGSYSIPSVVGTDLNRLMSSVVNNSADNSSSNSININNTYQVDATSDFNTKNFSNNLDKQFKNTLRKFGKI
jgi:hypothetical protein